MSAKKTTYEYGKGNTFIRKDGTVGTVTQLPPNVPEPGDILFYKKRDWKKRRLNEMNQWKFVCIETQGQEKGKWKVQGLHKEVGDFNWFEPHSLMRSSEVTNDLITKTQYPVKEDTKVKQNKKPISVTKPEGDTRKKVRDLLGEGMRQSDIARELGLTQATISQHAKHIKNERPLPGEHPIFDHNEAAEYLGISTEKLRDLSKQNSINAVVRVGRPERSMFTEYQIDKLTNLLEKERKQVTPEELGNYGANYQAIDQTKPTEHKATVEMKNYNYKRVISENLKMIKSLIHQTNELLEKIQ